MGPEQHDSDRVRLVGGSGRLGSHHRDRGKGRDLAAGGIGVRQTPGAAVGETDPSGRGGHESGHPARSNSPPISKRHSRLILPKSSSWFCTCQNSIPTRALSNLQGKLPKFLPHPPTAAEHSYAVLKSAFFPKGFGRARLVLTPGMGSPAQAPQSSDGWPPPLLCRPRVIGVNVPFGHCPLGSYRPGLTSRWVVPSSVNWLVTRV